MGALLQLAELKRGGYLKLGDAKPGVHLRLFRPGPQPHVIATAGRQLVLMSSEFSNVGQPPGALDCTEENAP
jgi:hypothetical protein